MARLLSVNVGVPREVTWNGKTVRTAVWKSPVRERRRVRKLNIDGDAQVDFAGHGVAQIWRQSKENPFLPPSRANLLLCGCKWIRIIRQFFAAIPCPICQQSITSASASRASRLASEVRFCATARAKAICWRSARRGEVLLWDPQRVLLSAGVGATPVLSMLHALAAEKSQRQVWWIYGARNRDDHPFAEESRSLLDHFNI